MGWGEAADSSNKTRLVVGVCGGGGIDGLCGQLWSGVGEVWKGRDGMKRGTGERKELWPGVGGGGGSWISTKRVGVGRVGGCLGWGGRWGWRWGGGGGGG